MTVGQTRVIGACDMATFMMHFGSRASNTLVNWILAWEMIKIRYRKKPKKNWKRQK